jgi:hypothetical protein
LVEYLLPVVIVPDYRYDTETSTTAVCRKLFYSLYYSDTLLVRTSTIYCNATSIYLISEHVWWVTPAIGIFVGIWGCISTSIPRVGEDSGRYTIKVWVETIPPNIAL